MLSLQCKRACNLAKQGGMWKRTPHGMCVCRVQSRAGGHPHQLVVSKISRGTRGTTSAMNGPDCHQDEATNRGHSLHHKVGEVSHPQQPMPTHYQHLQGLVHTHPTLTGSSTAAPCPWWCGSGAHGGHHHPPTVSGSLSMSSPATAWT